MNNFNYKFINIYISGLCIIGLLINSSILQHKANLEKNIHTEHSKIPLVCPSENEEARSLVEEFLTSSSFTQKRSEIGIENFTLDDIKLLKEENNDDNQVCNELKNIGLFNPSDDTVRTTVYYKLDNFYLVSMPITQKEIIYEGKQVVIASGPQFLTILDSSLDKIATINL